MFRSSAALLKSSMAGIIIGAVAIGTAQAQTFTGNNTMADHPYVGMWVTDDGHIRHELLPNSRYDEARGERQSAYQGRYRVTGNTIEYWDDTGFTADGEFIDGILHHAGMILRREQ